MSKHRGKNRKIKKKQGEENGARNRNSCSYEGNSNERQVSLNNVFYFEGAERICYLENLVSKQLDLYTWCEEKVTTLATIDSILLASATLFVEHIRSGDFPQRIQETWLSKLQIIIENNFSAIMVLFIIFPIFISLGITLWHVIPKMSSGATPNTIRNHRSSSGIHKYKDIPEYKSRIDLITGEEIYEDLIRQIYGMNNNIWKNQISIKIAVYFDLIGLFGFFLVMLYLVFNGSGLVFS